MSRKVETRPSGALDAGDVVKKDIVVYVITEKGTDRFVEVSLRRENAVDFIKGIGRQNYQIKEMLCS